MPVPGRPAAVPSCSGDRLPWGQSSDPLPICCRGPRAPPLPPAQRHCRVRDACARPLLTQLHGGSVCPPSPSSAPRLFLCSMRKFQPCRLAPGCCKFKNTRARPYSPPPSSLLKCTIQQSFIPHHPRPTRPPPPTRAAPPSPTPPTASWTSLCPTPPCPRQPPSLNRLPLLNQLPHRRPCPPQLPSLCLSRRHYWIPLRPPLPPPPYPCPQCPRCPHQPRHPPCRRPFQIPRRRLWPARPSQPPTRMRRVASSERCVFRR